MKKISFPSKIPYLLLALFAVYVYVQHQFVFLYFDDYGYASLSYGQIFWNGGTDYPLKSILDFLKWQYLNWGGRVLPFFCEIVSMKIGLWFIRLVQTILIVCSVYVSWLLIKKENTSGVLELLSLIVGYAALGLSTFEDGLFWFSASSLYFWPLPLFLTAVYLWNRASRSLNPRSAVPVALLMFLSAFSFEQTAVLVESYVVFRLLTAFLRLKKISGSSVIILISSTAGALLEILAPGNFVRSQTNLYDSFYAMPLMLRIKKNLKTLLEINCGGDNSLTILLMSFAMFLTLWTIYNRCSKKSKWIPATGFFLVSLCLAIRYLYPGIIQSSRIYYLALLMLCLLLFVCVFYISLPTLFETESQTSTIFFLLCSGLCSQAVMLISPTISNRCHIPLVFMLNLAMAYLTGEYLPSPRRLFHMVNIIFFSVLAVLSLNNTLWLTKGYYNNSEINEINRCKLKEQSTLWRNSNGANQLTLYRLKDDRFGCDMPYQQPYMSGWLKYYYDLPQNVEFSWAVYDTSANAT